MNKYTPKMNNDVVPVDWNYTVADFVSSDAPYAELEQYKENPFLYDRMRYSLQAYARKLGVPFGKLLSSYERSQKMAEKEILVNNQTDFEGQMFELDAGQWSASDSGITRSSGFGGVDVACSHPIMPVCRYVNIDTGDEKLELAFRRGAKTPWRSIIVDKRILASSSKVTDLASKGISITSQTAHAFVDYINDMEDLNYEVLPEKKSVSRLGYIEGEGFAPYVDGIIFDGEDAFASMFKTIHEHGDYNEWVKVAREFRGMSVTAKILLAASFASPLIEPIGSNSFFVHLWGSQSGSGKTVALMFAASVWGEPSVGAYVKTFNATAAGLERTAQFLHQLPLCLDELQLTRDGKGGKSNMDVVYQLSEGAGKIRSNKAGGLDATAQWRNCFLSTGETPLTSSGSGAGEINRIIDIECGPKEPVCVDGNRLSRAIKRNYGFAGKRFVEKLYADGGGMEAVIERYQEINQALLGSDTTEKQAMAAALIILADELACKWVFDGQEQPITVEAMSQFLASKAAVSAGSRAYQYICDWVGVNGAKLCGSSDVGEVWGKCSDNEDRVYIVRSVFNRIMSEGGFNASAIISAFLADNLMVRRGKNRTMSVRINGVQTECYCIILPGRQDDDELPMLEELIP